MVDDKSIAIIPARGGSKRIPHKNIIDFFGKPMIAHTIQAALDSGVFDSVVVSTDDAEIAEVARASGAEVPFLRQQFADDVSPISQATVWTLQQIEKQTSKQYAVVCQLMANCPLRSSESIQAAAAEFKNKQRNFQISACAYGWLNPWWAHVQSGDSVSPLFPDELKKRSQDQKELLCPSGAIWFARRDELLKQNSFYGSGYALFELDWTEAVDIDTYDDLNMAKAVYLMKTGKEML